MSRAQLKASRILWRRRRAWRRRELLAAKRTNNKARQRKWQDLLNEADRMIERRTVQLEKLTPLRLRAFNEAKVMVGVMESGGNNRGPGVEKIIREGGGLPGQAWCGWFCATAYKRAGSKAVTWKWGAVRLYVPLSGVSRTKTPMRGDLVRFTFDHIGMFDEWVDRSAGTFRTIEGNTGATGAVSDSKTGGDGVYRKVRNRSQVNDFLEITR